MSGPLLLICNSRSATISLHGLNRDQGQVELLREVPLPVAKGESSASPMVMSADERMLYLPWRGAQKSLMSFAFDKAKASLRLVDQQQIDEDICYLTLGLDGRYLLGAGGQHVVAYPLGRDGVPEKTGPKTHVGPLTHCVIEDGLGGVWATACQGDLLRRFTVDARTGSLHIGQDINQPPGSGPRHLCLSPDRQRLYLVTQESGEVVAFAADGHELQRMAMVEQPEIAVLGGDIVISSDGRFLYASERSTNSVVGFDVTSETDGMRRIGSVFVPDYPRALALHDDLLIALGFRGHSAAVFTIAGDGQLSLLTEFATGERPSWVLAVDGA